MNSTITSKELKDSLNQLQGTPIELKEPEYNIIIVQTSRGKMTIKTHLTAKEWVAQQELKLKNKPKKKKR
jgi:nitrate reductase NapAB chaperone NapD